MENKVTSVTSNTDTNLLPEKEIYAHDQDYQDKLFDESPWMKQEKYFKKAMLSTLAVMKIVDHAIRGKDREIIGYMTGFAKHGVYYVLDAVEIPLIGTDSRVEIAGLLGDKAHEYTANMKELAEKVGREQSFIGWYHSHPGFSCWLSGIDCKTQQTLQMVTKTFMAIVVDPYKTVANRKVDIGCFRCFNKEQTGNIADDFDVPKDFKELYGCHANKYYRLEHTFFQSKFETEVIKLIYKNYWIDTLSNNIYLMNNNNSIISIDNTGEKVNYFNLKSNAQNLRNKEQTNLQQRKMNEVANLNTQTTLNLQTELIKAMLFNSS